MLAANSDETGRQPPPSFPVGFSDDGDDGDDIQKYDKIGGDYTTRMEEVLGAEDEDEDEEFLYQGADTPEVSATYNEQLHDLLEGFDEEVNPSDQDEELQVEEQLDESYEEARAEALSDGSLSTPSPPFSNFHPGETPTITSLSPLKPSMPFIHPTISRLRSFVPTQQNKRLSSASNFPYASPSPSHLSTISRESSPSKFQSQEESRESSREVFRWGVLRDIGQQIYLRKATSILGSFHGSPTVLSVNGFICIGTDQGSAFVFDFKQQLKCICTTDDAVLVGPVSAISLSHDHTYLALGYAFGHINLYDISRPQTPMRSVPPTSLAAVASGRKEGHIKGARIVNLGFVGSRHTAIVSADEHGLAFYHSLGKVLFVEANDTLRILGKYPDAPRESTLPSYLPKDADPLSSHMNGGGTLPSNPVLPRPWKPRKGSTILVMSPLPLGASAHPTDAYSLIALLTPAKIVIVGLKPSPRTWFRRHRVNTGDSLPDSSKWKGCLAWFPSIDLESDANDKKSTKPKHLAMRPILAYSWDRTLCLLRVSETIIKQKIRSTKNPGKTIIVDVGKLEFEEIARWSSNADYLAIQWLNVHQLLALTVTHLEVWDPRTAQQIECVPFNTTSLSHSEPGEFPDDERVAHCMRVYKGKVFILGRYELKVGTLLSWADRILAFVEEGDFLSAIDTTRAYYVGTAHGNKLGLPDDPVALRALVGQRMRDLMTASARYAFSEDRMSDSTHVTPDGRGVDRTSLFEALVTVCANACLALDDFEFLFEDLFEYYQDAGIASIFLSQLEPCILDGTIQSIPPRITQRLIALHEDRGDLDKAERIIWHINPDCLDINQAITMCRRNDLYDALLYVYTRAMRDFVTPMVDLLGLVRQIQQSRRVQRLHPVSSGDIAPVPSNQPLENKASDAYKIYVYLADILSGLTYPSRIPMPHEEALQAKNDVYAFLFFGSSYVWPAGEGGKLISTSDEEGGVEPTYPYVRLLLRFDAEAFLHAMDMAFEDTYFNDDAQGVSRFDIVQILLGILSSPGLSNSDATMINIFIARNTPKYPQSILTYMAPSTLHGILFGLTADNDQSTREDRQLAAEYLLSVFMPHNSERIVELFQSAGFYRILRNWHRQEHKWGPLVSTYLQDPDVDPAEVFEHLGEVLSTASRANQGTLPVEVLTRILDAIPQLLDTGITETAILIDRYAAGMHEQVLDTIGSDCSHRQFAYMRCLIEPAALSDDIYWTDPAIQGLPPSGNLDQASRELYITLLCRYDSPGVIRCLRSLDVAFIDWGTVISICEQNGVNEAVIWCLNKRGDVMGAFEKLKIVVIRLASKLGGHLVSEQLGVKITLEMQNLLNEIKALGNIGLRICCEHSDADDVPNRPPVEDMWFTLLSSQIDAIQAVSGFCSSNTGDNDPVALQEQQTLDSLRSLVQVTFTSLMTLGSSSTLSFPRLFKRLVDSASKSRSSSQSSYSEFRLILAGMLDSYRSEADILLITNRLVEHDLFTTFKELTRRSVQGSRARTEFCTLCACSLQGNNVEETGHENRISRNNSLEGWVIQRLSGLPYHRRCLPATAEKSSS